MAFPDSHQQSATTKVVCYSAMSYALLCFTARFCSGEAFLLASHGKCGVARWYALLSCMVAACAIVFIPVEILIEAR